MHEEEGLVQVGGAGRGIRNLWPGKKKGKETKVHSALCVYVCCLIWLFKASLLQQQLGATTTTASAMSFFFLDGKSSF